jgi:hypothetical protein
MPGRASRKVYEFIPEVEITIAGGTLPLAVTLFPASRGSPAQLVISGREALRPAPSHPVILPVWCFHKIPGP